MKIVPVQNSNNTNFKGLWGTPEKRSGGNEFCFFDQTILHYYPFKNESEEEIDKIVKENSEEFVIKRFEAGDTTGESYRYVQVHEKLPFTRQEYRAYYKTYFLEGSTLEPGRTIEESLKTRGLTRYFAPNRITQKEWRNSIIEQFAPKNSIKRFFYMLRHRIKQIIR